MTLQDREVVQRLNALAAGKPIPRGETITVPVQEGGDRMALAFVRMGGEARPWAVGWQLGAGDAEILAVPDGRNTDPIGAMLMNLAGALGSFLGSAAFDGFASDLDQVQNSPLRQLWLPNGTHIEMLHMINLRYTFARGDEDPERTEALRSLGRAAGYLFREAVRPGEAGIINASRALLDAFVFPVDDVRAQHLGLLLAMLSTKGKLAARERAAEVAEAKSTSITLDPILERDVLEPLVADYNDAVSAGKSRKARSAERRIADVLGAEVRRRLELTVSAAELLAADSRPINQGVGALVSESLRTRWWEYLNLEAALAQGGEAWSPPSAETDRRGVAAAVRYIRNAGAADEQEAVLRLHDADLIDQAVATGDAVRGVVRRVDRRVAPGLQHQQPHWEIEMPLSKPFRLKAGDELLTILEEGPGGGWVTGIEQEAEFRVIVVCMNMRSTGQSADDPSFVGMEVTLVPKSGGFVAGKLRRARNGKGPGDWVTRRDGDPPRRRARRKGDLLAELEGLRRR